jgi:serine/threonine-protein kinase
LPADVLDEAVMRLRILAVLYAATYFAAAYIPNLAIPELTELFFGRTSNWLPGAVSIVGALVMAGITLTDRLDSLTKMRIGLAFLVLSSYGIAAAEYHDVSSSIQYREGSLGGFGLSWVAIWVLLFSVSVPNPPRLTALASAFAVTAVPAVYGFWHARGVNTVPLSAAAYFFMLVFPYVLVVGLTYAGSRIVYGLTRAVKEARELGSYRLVERLGTGAMGEVWRAQHRLLARPAAVKLVRPEVLGAKTPQQQAAVLQRFEREAQATALMRSSHTMELYDFGVADDGTFYYVMELLYGLDLDRLVETYGPLPPARVAPVLIQMCDSLGEAHAAGLIHRDIKPANVYLCRQGQQVDFVKLLDFGLVKRETPESGDVKLTAENAASGTPAFMSPEQVMGDDLDGRSDLYALGCVGYWLLTATLVFSGRTAMETMMMHARHPPDPMDQRTDLPIPTELETVIMDCLAKDPAERPASAEALQGRLERIAFDEPWTRERARRWWETHQPIPEG